MELRIIAYQSREKFASICEHYFRNLKDDIQYKFPYHVRYGQLEGVLCGFPKEFPECLICLEPLDGAQYVVLHHRQRYACNLCGKMYGLVFPEAKQVLQIPVGDLRCPSHGVNPVCLEEAETEVGCKESVPLPFPATLAEEQPDGSAGESYFNGTIRALKRSTVLAELPRMELPYNLLCREESVFRTVPCLTKLYHAYEVAFYVAAGYQTYEGSVGKPAVNQEIVKTDAALDGVLRHLTLPLFIKR